MKWSIAHFDSTLGKRTHPSTTEQENIILPWAWADQFRWSLSHIIQYRWQRWPPPTHPKQTPLRKDFGCEYICFSIDRVGNPAVIYIPPFETIYFTSSNLNQTKSTIFSKGSDIDFGNRLLQKGISIALCQHSVVSCISYLALIFISIWSLWCRHYKLENIGNLAKANIFYRLLLGMGALAPQIAEFMGPTWGPPGSCRPQMGPGWPHEPCYQGL